MTMPITPNLMLVLVVAIGCAGNHQPASRPVAPQPHTTNAAGSPEAAAHAMRHSGACMPVPWRNDDDADEAIYEGRLDRIEVTLPNGTFERPLLVILDRPACLPAHHDDHQADEIQVYSLDPALHARLESLLGRHVVVTGNGFVAHTAHHHRPIVVEVRSVAGI